MLRDREDAYGHQVFDCLKGKKDVWEIVERDDGLFTAGARYYFREYEDWYEHERMAVRYAKGRILDVGCGAGRVCLYLQKKGFDVLGVDISPLAIQVCKLRGVKNALVMPITKLSSKLGKFDTVIMFGNNFALFGNPKRARWLLRRFYKLTTPNGRIIAESIDPYDTNEPDHLCYHQLNKRSRRMGGEVRERVRYRKYMTPWFDYLLVSKQEMRSILKGTDWQISKTFRSRKSSAYIAIIEKQR
jgi:2-polyprenyl-3-methyl-5-hydroxy-6-metoxy-1,4-benzoquinol methylase